eukprot:Gb_12663 [translate_table: standard]
MGNVSLCGKWNVPRLSYLEFDDNSLEAQIPQEIELYYPCTSQPWAKPYKQPIVLSTSLACAVAGVEAPRCYTPRVLPTTRVAILASAKQLLNRTCSKQCPHLQLLEDKRSLEDEQLSKVEGPSKVGPSPKVEQSLEGKGSPEVEESLKGERIQEGEKLGGELTIELESFEFLSL